jgi:hypothetical protein
MTKVKDERTFLCTEPCMTRVRRIHRGETFNAREMKRANGGVMPDEEWLDANFTIDGTLPDTDEEKAVKLSKGEGTPVDGGSDQFEDISDDPSDEDGEDELDPAHSASEGDPAPQGGIDDKPEDSWTKEAMQNWIMAKGHTFKKSASKKQLMAQIKEIQSTAKAMAGDGEDW